MTISLKSSADGLSAIIQINGVDKATVDNTGKITANSFAGTHTGDGSALTGITTLPTQTGNAGKVLNTDGTNASWAGGTGSGIDADLLDGIHASGFIQTSAMTLLGSMPTFPSSNVVGALAYSAGASSASVGLPTLGSTYAADTQSRIIVNGYYIYLSGTNNLTSGTWKCVAVGSTYDLTGYGGFVITTHLFQRVA